MTADALSSALAVLDESIAAVSLALHDLEPVTEETDPDSAITEHARMLDALRQRVTDLRATEQPLCSLLGALLRQCKDGTYTDETTGVYARRRGGGSAYSAWRHTELVESVVPMLLAQPVVLEDTGEVVEDISESTARTVLDRWLFVSGYAWKSSGLRKVGINPDHYAERKPAPVSIEVRVTDPASQTDTTVEARLA